MTILEKILQFLEKILHKTSNKKQTEESKQQDKTRTYIVGENKELTEGDNYDYHAWLYNDSTKNLITDKTLHVKINDTIYDLTADETGTYKLPIHLMAKTWTLHTSFDGDDEYESSSVDNTLYIKPKPVKQETTTIKQSTPKPTSKPATPTQKQTIYPPNNKGEYWVNRYLSGQDMKQATTYWCAPTAITQVWYELFGDNLSQTTIARMAGTTQDGTSHSGINTALNQLAKRYGKNITIEWRNYSDLTSNDIAQIFRDPRKACLWHVMWHNLNNWEDTGGHYCYYACINPKGKYVYEAYSLSGPSLIKRSFDYVKTVTGEISQPSCCIVTSH